MKDKTMAPAKGATRVVLALALAGSCAFAQSSAAEAATAKLHTNNQDRTYQSDTADAARPDAGSGETQAAAAGESRAAAATASPTASPTAAEEAAATELPPVTVSAHDGMVLPCDQTGVSVSVIDVKQKLKEGINDLTGALAEVPGLYVLPGGDYQRGNYTAVTIRGVSGGSDVLPMMDGMRLTNTSTTLTQNVIARTNLRSIDNVEVLRGPQGAVYGGGNIGGVICMETPKGQGKPSFSTFNETGSFDSYTNSTTVQGSTGKFAFFLNASYDRTGNDLSYADGSKPLLKHAGLYRNYQESLRLDYALNDDNELTLTYRREDATYNNAGKYPAYGAAQAVEELSRYSFRSNLVTARWQSRVNDFYALSLMAGYYGVDNNLSSPTYPFVSDLRNVQLEWRNRFTWNEHHKTQLGFSWLRSDYGVESGADYARDISSCNLETTSTVFAEHLWQPAQNWDNSLALRLENSSVYGSHFTFRAASNYRFNDSSSRVFASVGTGYRAPSSFQRSRAVYDSGYGLYRGNPELDCETSVSVDLGFEQRIVRDHSFTATLFWQQKSGAITTVSGLDPQTGLWTSSFVNDSGHQTLQGVELALHGQFEPYCKTGYRLACTLAQPLGGDDRQVAYSARQTWYADLHTSPLEGLTTGIGLVAAGGRTGWSVGQPRLDSYYMLRWYASYEVNENLTLHLRVENLTNQKFITAPSYNGAAGLDPACSVINAGVGVFGGATIKF